MILKVNMDAVSFARLKEFLDSSENRTDSGSPVAEVMSVKSTSVAQRCELCVTLDVAEVYRSKDSQRSSIDGASVAADLNAMNLKRVPFTAVESLLKILGVFADRPED